MMGILMAHLSSSKSRRGAVGTSIGLIGRIKATLGHHSHSLQDSLKRLFKDPLQTLMTTSVIAIALSLPATLFLVVDNVRQVENNFKSFSQISVYVDSDADLKKIARIKSQLTEMPGVESVFYISPKQALQEFTQSSGFGTALKHLENNPLPPVFIVEPKLAVPLNTEQVQKLMTTIGQIPDVEEAQIDMLWLQRLRSLTQVGQKIVFALGLSLGLGVLIIISNSIRLAIHNRREEITVVKLVGGTNAYVRRPFLYSGSIMGVFGALGAALILGVGFWWFGSSVAQLSELYNSQYRLHGPGLKGYMLLVAIGSGLGLSGSWLAVGKHLNGIKPK
jgi:cell division transport system permease protein